MSVRFKLAAIASATLLTAGLAAAFAAPAFANGQNGAMCVFNTKNYEQCAMHSTEGQAIPMVTYKEGAPPPDTWNAPGLNSIGQISEYGVSPAMCMQIIGGLTGSINDLVEARPCTSSPYAEWQAIPVPPGYGDRIYYWNAKYNLCLNDVYYDGKLNAETCDIGNYNQYFLDNAP
jgi:hypothetical protein